VIRAIDAGIGFKEDAPVAKTPTGGGGDFARILQHATAGKTDVGLKAIQSNAGLVPGEIAGDPHFGEQFLKELEGAGTPSAAQTGEAPSALSEMLDHAADTAAIPDRMPGQEAIAQLDDLPAAQMNGLQPTDPPTQAQSIEQASSIQEQIGMTAYRLSPHGKGESGVTGNAAEAGAGAMNAAMDPDGAGLATSAATAFAMAKEVDPDPNAKGASPELKAAVEDGQQIQQEDVQSKALRQFNLDAALSRDRMMQQVAAAQTASTEAAKVFGEAERGKLHLNGLLARNLRTLSGELKSPGNLTGALAAPGTMPGATASAAMAGMIYDTPMGEPAQARMIDQIAHQASWVIENNRQQVSFRLSPEHLGDLHLKVSREDGVFRVDMQVDSLMAKQIIESNLHELKEQLMGEHSGGEFLFNVDVQQGDDGHRQFFGESSQESLGMRNGEPVSTVDHTTATPRSAFRPSGLSVYA